MALDEPMTTKVFGRSKRENPPNSYWRIDPEHLVYRVDWECVDRKFLTDKIAVIDFGESFDIAAPSSELGLPPKYRAPELWLENKINVATDLWALGCTLHEIRLGTPLVAPFDDEMDAYLEATVEALGPLPEPWWSTTKARSQFFEEMPDEHGLPVSVSDGKGDESRTLRSLVTGSLSFWKYGWNDNLQALRLDEQLEEIDILLDLLKRLLAYRPNERHSAAEIVEHPCFRL